MMYAWTWADVLGAAQAQAHELAVTAQEIAEKEARNIVQHYTATIENAGVIQTPSRDNGVAYTTPSSCNVDLVSGSVDLAYITKYIIAMAFPYDPSKSTSADGGNNMHSVSHYLNRKHDGHYMAWNISEETHDISFFENQVLQYKFPGHPAPPFVRKLNFIFMIIC